MDLSLPPVDYAGSLIHAPHGTTSLDDGSSELCSEGTNLQFVDVQGFTVNLTEESDTHSFGDLFFLHASASANAYDATYVTPRFQGGHDTGSWLAVATTQAQIFHHSTLGFSDLSVAQNTSPWSVSHPAILDPLGMENTTTPSSTIAKGDEASFQRRAGIQAESEERLHKPPGGFIPNNMPAGPVLQRNRVTSDKTRCAANRRRAQDSIAKWKCHLCNDSFTRGFNLKAHLNSHTGRKPYFCAPCGQGFTRRPDLGRHQRTKKHAERCSRTCGE